MAVDASRALQPSLAAAPELALAGRLDPAWIIDPARGRVLAANPAGAARLGLRPDAASGTLDAAMPGLVRLRAMLHEPLQEARREPLIFWTAYGAENLMCDVAAVPGSQPDAGQRPGPPSLVLVSLAGAETREGKRSEAAPAAALPAAAATPEDAATLAKIARAVRNGFGAGRGETPLPLEADEEAFAAPPERAAHIAKLAHELRTPLSAIAAAAEIMRDERFGAIGNERYRSYSSDIHDNAQHALALIKRLLGADPADAGERANIDLDLNALAQSSVSALGPLAEAARIRLGLELHTHLPLVNADPTAVKQIVFNLLSNAIKFTAQGGDVRVVTGLGYDRSVFIAVQDSGAGMTPEAVAAALRSDVPTHPQPRPAGGHGIGLPLARSLAEANGARLEIDSAPREGTAVAVIFPKDKVSVRAALPPPASN